MPSNLPVDPGLLGFGTWPTVLALLVGFAVPLATAVVTSRLASGPFKVAITAALTAAGGFLTAWQTMGDAYNWKRGALLWAVSLIVALVSDFHLWSPVGAQAAIYRAVPAGLRGRSTSAPAS